MKTWVLPLGLLAAACSPPASDSAKTDTAPMTEPAASAVAGPITATGTVTAVDAAAGTVSLDHEPIAAISWPAMSMQFTAENPTILQGIAVGDRVSFELKSASETQVVIAIQQQ